MAPSKQKLSHLATPVLRNSIKNDTGKFSLHNLLLSSSVDANT
jgi:hypothetical protein